MGQWVRKARQRGGNDHLYGVLPATRQRSRNLMRTRESCCYLQKEQGFRQVPRPGDKGVFHMIEDRPGG